MSLRSEVIRAINEYFSSGFGKKITELPSVTTPLAGTELLEIVQAGESRKVTAASLATGGTGVETIVAGTNITVDDTDPQNPIISASGGGGGGTWGSITGTLSDQTDLNSALSGKQATLVSGTNIKTINSTSILGSGDISLAASVPDADATTKGIARLYPSTSLGTNTDGAPTQNAVKVYVDAVSTTVSGLVIDSIADADTMHAPSRNAVFDALALKAPIASPALTGTPTAPTATAGTNTTQIATTAYTTTALSTALGIANVGNLLSMYNKFI